MRYKIDYLPVRGKEVDKKIVKKTLDYAYYLVKLSKNF